MTENSILTAVLMGALVGALCLGGMLLGLGLLLKTQEPGFPEGHKKKLYYLAGAIILVGQFWAAMRILTQTRWVREQPIPTGGGMVVTILFASVILNLYYKNNKK